MRQLGMTLLITWFIIGVLGELTELSLAQPTNALLVPDGECSPCPTGAVVHPPACGGVFRCYRRDQAPVEVAPGYKTKATGEVLETDTCAPECACTPAPTMVHSLTAEISIQVSRTISASVAPGLEVGIDIVQAAIKGSFGYDGTTNRVFTVTAGSQSFPSCRLGRYQVELVVRKGVVHEVAHQYEWWWMPFTIPPNPINCSTVGGQSNVCGILRSSTGTSDLWGVAKAGWLGNQPCP